MSKVATHKPEVIEEPSTAEARPHDLSFSHQQVLCHQSRLVVGLDYSGPQVTQTERYMTDNGTRGGQDEKGEGGKREREAP